LLNVHDPAGFVLFVIPSVLVSLAFAPILLSVTPTPAFDTTKAMGLKELYETSPTSFVGMFLMGAVFAAQFGMASIFGTEAGLSVAEISLFVSAIFVGGLVFQYPVGWMSDRMDRRILIFGTAAGGCLAAVIGLVFGGVFEALLIAGFLMGGVSNPLYALLIAYTNDYLEPDDMAAASGGLIFVNGLGAIIGPILTGWALSAFGASGFWVYLLCVMAILLAYVAYRMTQRASLYQSEDDYEAVAYAAITPTATPVAVEVAQEVYAENAEGDDEDGAKDQTSLANG